MKKPEYRVHGLECASCLNYDMKEDACYVCVRHYTNTCNGKKNGMMHMFTGEKKMFKSILKILQVRMHQIYLQKHS